MGNAVDVSRVQKMSERQLAVVPMLGSCGSEKDVWRNQVTLSWHIWQEILNCLMQLTILTVSQYVFTPKSRHLSMALRYLFSLTAAMLKKRLGKDSCHLAANVQPCGSVTLTYVVQFSTKSSASIWVLNQKKGGKTPPNHPFVNRVFHYFHHPFWVFLPLFLGWHPFLS